VKAFRHFALAGALLALTLTAVNADQKAEWLRIWNSTTGREIQLKAEDVLLKECEKEPLAGLVAAGIRQSDGSFTLAQVVWKSEASTPLLGFGRVLSDLNFQDLDDQTRRATFLLLLQETYGAVGTKPYTGPPSREQDRPSPMRGLRGPDDSHRFQVWYYDVPIQTEGGEWREVLYSVSPDGTSIRSRTLGTYFPLAERLRGFPAISSELFE
jgi:hypothetical protein